MDYGFDNTSYMYGSHVWHTQVTSTTYMRTIKNTTLFVWKVPQTVKHIPQPRQPSITTTTLQKKIFNKNTWRSLLGRLTLSRSLVRCLLPTWLSIFLSLSLLLPFHWGIRYSFSAMCRPLKINKILIVSMSRILFWINIRVCVCVCRCACVFDKSKSIRKYLLLFSFQWSFS